MMGFGHWLPFCSKSKLAEKPFTAITDRSLKERYFEWCSLWKHRDVLSHHKALKTKSLYALRNMNEKTNSSYVRFLS